MCSETSIWASRLLRFLSYQVHSLYQNLIEWWLLKDKVDQFVVQQIGSLQICHCNWDQTNHAHFISLLITLMHFLIKIVRDGCLFGQLHWPKLVPNLPYRDPQTFQTYRM
jgi:hypothetical protein